MLPSVIFQATLSTSGRRREALVESRQQMVISDAQAVEPRAQVRIDTLQLQVEHAEDSRDIEVRRQVDKNGKSQVLY